MIKPSFISAVLVTLLCFEYGTSTARQVLKSRKEISVQNAIGNISKSAEDDLSSGKYVCPHPADCEELHTYGYHTSGVYAIWPRSRALRSESVRVYCDMVTNGGGWTVIQRRGNFGSPDDYFYEDWKYYKQGFGSVKSDFWLGNDNIYAISNQGSYELRIDMKHTNGTSAYAHYKSFWINDEGQGYKLHVSKFNGNAGDGLYYNHGRKFSTKDRMNGPNNSSDATLHKGGWWYSSSFYSNLNGLYRPTGKLAEEKNVVSWYTFGGDKNCLLSTEMKIRPVNR